MTLVTVVGIAAILTAIYFAWNQLWRMLKRMDRRDDERDLRERQRDKLFQLIVKALRDRIGLSLPDDLPSAAGDGQSVRAAQVQSRPRHLWVVKALVPVLAALGVLAVWLRGEWQAATVVTAAGLAVGLIAATGPAETPPPQQPLPEVAQPVITPPATVPLPPPARPPSAPVAVRPPKPAPMPASSPAPRTTPPVTSTVTVTAPPPPTPASLINPLPTTPTVSTQCTITALDKCISNRSHKSTGEKRTQ